MAGRTSEFSTEELGLAGATVDMLANGFFSLVPKCSAVTFLPTSLPLHPHFDLLGSARSSEEERNFIPGRFSFLRSLVYHCLTCLQLSMSKSITTKSDDHHKVYFASKPAS